MQMLNYIHLTCIYRCDEINSSAYIRFKLSLLDQHEGKESVEGMISSYDYKFGCAIYHKYCKTKVCIVTKGIHEIYQLFLVTLDGFMMWNVYKILWW